MTKRYVVGFPLNDSRLQVALVRKNRPAWQSGRLNGIGGKVEPGETLVEAMVRELEEETGLDAPSTACEEMCTIAWPDDEVRVADAEPTTVTFFRVLPGVYSLIPHVRTVTDERIEVWSVYAVRADRVDVIPNLRWLVPLAAYTADHYAPFTVKATVAEELVQP